MSVVRGVVVIAAFMSQASFTDRPPASSDVVSGARVIELPGGSERGTANPKVLLPPGFAHLQQRAIVEYACASGKELICACPGRAGGTCQCKC